MPLTADSKPPGAITRFSSTALIFVTKFNTAACSPEDGVRSWFLFRHAYKCEKNMHKYTASVEEKYLQKSNMRWKCLTIWLGTKKYVHIPHQSSFLLPVLSLWEIPFHTVKDCINIKCERQKIMTSDCLHNWKYFTNKFTFPV